MAKWIFWMGLSGVSLGAIAPGAIAQEAPPSMANLNLPPLQAPIPASPDVKAPTVAEVLPASSFTDVSPTHWAYTAVTNLSQSYGCVSGYPDDTFRGEEYVTRYEFAAALNACLDNFVQVIEQDQQSSLDGILEDLEALESELGTLSDDVNGLAGETFH